MDKPKIIGTGFSGLIAYLSHAKNAEIFGGSSNIAFTNKKSDFTFNKIFGLKAKSQTRLKNKLINIHLHDRLINGGNGTIWGGFFNDEDISDCDKKILVNNGIKIIKLNSWITGSYSPNKNIKQLQNEKLNIVNPSNHIDSIENKYLDGFKVEEDESLICYWLENDNQRTVSKVTGKIYFAIGVVQLIDLLFRSNYLKDNDVLKMSEYSYKLTLILRSKKITSEVEVIRFNFLRGVLHSLGINYYPKLLIYIDHLIPIVFEQSFGPIKNDFQFFIKNNALESECEIFNIKHGKSIHYCNLHVNNIPISNFLKKISPKIVGIGMAFVDQKKPGPISNEIFKDILLKVLVEK